MLLGRQRLALGPQRPERLDDVGAGVGRRDHGVDVATLSGDVGVGQGVLVLGDELLSRRLDVLAALGRFEDAFESELGFPPPVEPMWDTAEETPEEDLEVDADTFSMNVEIGFEPGAAPTRMDDVVGVLQQVTENLVDRLEGDGYVVTQYSVVGTAGGDLDDELDDSDDSDDSDDPDDPDQP